jgi:hypothetical protein
MEVIPMRPISLVYRKRTVVSKTPRFLASRRRRLLGLIDRLLGLLLTSHALALFMLVGNSFRESIDTVQ